MDGEITSGRMQKLLGINKVALMTLTTRRLWPGRKPSTTNTSLRRSWRSRSGCDLADDRIKASVVGHGNTETFVLDHVILR
jgi:hypothetical protein